MAGGGDTPTNLRLPMCQVSIPGPKAAFGGDCRQVRGSSEGKLPFKGTAGNAGCGDD